MRLRTLIVACALALAACGTSNVLAKTGTSTKLYVKLQCVNAPCGSDGHEYWHGGFVAVEANGFGARSPYIVTVTYPDGKPYNNYDRPASRFGVSGGLKYTDKQGKPSSFLWSTNNAPRSKQVDPPGVYKVKFTTKVHGKTKHYTTHFRMRELTKPDGS